MKKKIIWNTFVKALSMGTMLCIYLCFPKMKVKNEQKANTKIQKEHNDDGLPSSWIQYNQTVRHRYILFVFMVCSPFVRFFPACSPGLVYLGPTGRSILICVSRLAHKKLSIDVKTCTVDFALFQMEKIILIFMCKRMHNFFSSVQIFARF